MHDEHTTPAPLYLAVFITSWLLIAFPTLPTVLSYSWNPRSHPLPLITTRTYLPINFSPTHNSPPPSYLIIHSTVQHYSESSTVIISLHSPTLFTVFQFHHFALISNTIQNLPHFHHFTLHYSESSSFIISLNSPTLFIIFQFHFTQ